MTPPSSWVEKLLRGDLLAMSTLEWERSRALLLNALEDRLPGYSRLEDDDPLIAMLEAFAAGLDVLGFYHDRILTESKLATAQQQSSVARLAQLLAIKPNPAIAARTVLFFEAKVPGLVPLQSRVSGSTGNPPTTVLFETQSELPITPTMNDMLSSPIVTLEPGALRLILRGVEQDIAPEMHLRPADRVIVWSPSGIELPKVNEVRRRGIALETGLSRSYSGGHAGAETDTDTLVQNRVHIRHLRTKFALSELPFSDPASDPELIAFEVSPRPILHIPSVEDPTLLKSTLEIFVFDNGELARDPSTWTPQNAWVEVADFWGSNFDDLHYRIFVDDRMASWVIVRRKLGHRVILSDEQLDSVYARFCDAIGDITPASRPDGSAVYLVGPVGTDAGHVLYESGVGSTPPLDLRESTLCLDASFYRNAICGPKVKKTNKDGVSAESTPPLIVTEDSSSYHGAFRLVTDRALGLSTEAQIVIRDNRDGANYLRTIARVKGQRIQWDGALPESSASLSSSLWTQLDQYFNSTSDYRALIEDQVGSTYLLTTTFQLGNPRENSAILAAPSSLPDQFNPIDKAMDLATTTVVPIEEAVRGQYFPWWDEYYRRQSFPEFQIDPADTTDNSEQYPILGSNYDSGAPIWRAEWSVKPIELDPWPDDNYGPNCTLEPSLSAFKGNAIVSIEVIPRGTSFLTLSDATLIKAGDFLLLGRRVRAKFRIILPDDYEPGEHDLTDFEFRPNLPWLSAEVVQVAEVQGRVVRLVHPTSERYTLDYLGTDSRLIEPITIIRAIPAVSSVYFGHQFTQELYLRTDSTVIKQEAIEGKYLAVTMDDPIDIDLLFEQLAWNALTPEERWKDLFLAASGQVEEPTEASWSYQMDISASDLNPDEASALQLLNANNANQVTMTVSESSRNGYLIFSTVNAAEIRGFLNALPGAGTVDVDIITSGPVWNYSTSATPETGTFIVVMEAGWIFAPDQAPPLSQDLLEGGGVLFLNWDATAAGYPFHWLEQSDGSALRLDVTAGETPSPQNSDVEGQINAVMTTQACSSSQTYEGRWKFVTGIYNEKEGKWLGVVTGGILLLWRENAQRALYRSGVRPSYNQKAWRSARSTASTRSQVAPNGVSPTFDDLNFEVIDTQYVRFVRPILEGNTLDPIPDGTDAYAAFRRESNGTDVSITPIWRLTLPYQDKIPFPLGTKGFALYRFHAGYAPYAPLLLPFEFYHYDSDDGDLFLDLINMDTLPWAEPSEEAVIWIRALWEKSFPTPNAAESTWILTARDDADPPITDASDQGFLLLTLGSSNSGSIVEYSELSPHPCLLIESSSTTLGDSNFALEVTESSVELTKDTTDAPALYGVVCINREGTSLPNSFTGFTGDALIAIWSDTDPADLFIDAYRWLGDDYKYLELENETITEMQKDASFDLIDIDSTCYEYSESATYRIISIVSVYDEGTPPTLTGYILTVNSPLPAGSIGIVQKFLDAYKYAPISNITVTNGGTSFFIGVDDSIINLEQVLSGIYFAFAKYETTSESAWSNIARIQVYSGALNLGSTTIEELDMYLCLSGSSLNFPFEIIDRVANGSSWQFTLDANYDSVDVTGVTDLRLGLRHWDSADELTISRYSKITFSGQSAPDYVKTDDGLVLEDDSSYAEFSGFGTHSESGSGSWTFYLKGSINIEQYHTLYFPIERWPTENNSSYSLESITRFLVPRFESNDGEGLTQAQLNQEFLSVSSICILKVNTNFALSSHPLLTAETQLVDDDSQWRLISSTPATEILTTTALGNTGRVFWVFETALNLNSNDVTGIGLDVIFASDPWSNALNSDRLYLNLCLMFFNGNTEDINTSDWSAAVPTTEITSIEILSSNNPTLFIIRAEVELTQLFNADSTLKFDTLAPGQAWTDISSDTVREQRAVLQVGSTLDGRNLGLGVNDSLQHSNTAGTTFISIVRVVDAGAGKYETDAPAGLDWNQLTLVSVRTDYDISAFLFALDLRAPHDQAPWLLTTTGYSALNTDVSTGLLRWMRHVSNLQNGLEVFYFSGTSTDDMIQLTNIDSATVRIFTNQSSTLNETLYLGNLASIKSVKVNNFIDPPDDTNCEPYGCFGELMASASATLFSGQYLPASIFLASRAAAQLPAPKIVESGVASAELTSIPIYALSESVVFNTGNFIPLKYADTSEDAEIVSNALRIFASFGENHDNQLMTYDPELTIYVQEMEAGTFEWEGDKYIYNFNRTVTGVFTFNFLIITGDPAISNPNGETAVKVRVYVEYFAPHAESDGQNESSYQQTDAPEANLYDFETSVHLWNPLRTVAMLDPGSLKVGDYLFLRSAPVGSSAPNQLPVQWTQVSGIDERMVNVSPPLFYQPSQFRQYTLSGYSKSAKPAKLHAEYYSQLVKTTFTVETVGGTSSYLTSLVLRDRLMVDPDASEILLRNLIPGDHLLVWDGRWRKAFYDRRASGSSTNLEDPYWAEWPDYQHEVVIKKVDRNLGMLVFERPLPPWFEIHYTFWDVDETASTGDKPPFDYLIASDESFDSQTMGQDEDHEGIRIRPLYRAPFQGPQDWVSLGEGDGAFKFQTFPALVPEDSGDALLPLTAHAMMSNTEVLSVDPRSSAWQRWVRFDELENAGKKDRACVVSIQPTSWSDAPRHQDEVLSTVPFAAAFGDGRTGQVLPSGQGTANVFARVTRIGNGQSTLQTPRLLPIQRADIHCPPLVGPEGIFWQPTLRICVEGAQQSSWQNTAWISTLQVALERVNCETGGSVCARTYIEISRDLAAEGKVGFIWDTYVDDEGHEHSGVIALYLMDARPILEDRVEYQLSVQEDFGFNNFSLDADFYDTLKNPGQSPGSKVLSVRETAGLQPGSLLALENRLTDRQMTVPELITVSAVDHGTWSVDLEQPLTGVWPSVSTRLRGNLVAALQGRTQSYIIGSGDGRTPELRLALHNREPLLVSLNEDGSQDPGVSIRVDGITWTRVTNLLDSEPLDRHWTLTIDARGDAYCSFGDGIRGAIPASGLDNISVSLRTGGGAAGNIQANGLAALVTGLIGVKSVRNLLPASGAQNAELPDDTRQRLLTRPATFGRAISAMDLSALALEVGGVVDAQLEPSSSHRPIVRVALSGRRVATPADLEEISTRLTRRLPAAAGVSITVVAATPVAIHLVLDITLGIGGQRDIVDAQLRTALSSSNSGFFAEARWKIGQPIRAELIYAEVLKISGVGAALIRWLAPTPPPQQLPRVGAESFDPGPRGLVQCDHDRGARSSSGTLTLRYSGGGL